MELTQQLIDTLSKKTHFNNFDIKAKGNRGFFKGFASTWDLDEGGDRIIPGAFVQDLSKFMENPVMLFSHQLDKVIGSWKMLEEQERGLYGEAEINLNTQLGKDVYALIKDGDLKGLSIGYEVGEDSVDKVTGVRNLIKVKLWEISVVAIPMNQTAWIAGTKIFTGVDLAKSEEKEDEFKFKFRHKDKDLKFDDVAVDMFTLVNEDTDCDFEETFKHLAKHYKELKKELPLADSDEMWQSDEPYIMEQLRFNGAIETIVNLAKHWQSEQRNQSELEGAIAEACIKMTELLPQTNEVKETNPNKDKEEIEIMLKAIEDAKSTIAKVSNLESDIKDSVKKMFNEVLGRATGKDLK